MKAEGGDEEAALPPPGVVGPLAPLELLLLACASESLDSDDELLTEDEPDEDRLWHRFSVFPFFWHDCEEFASYLSNRLLVK